MKKILLIISLILVLFLISFYLIQEEKNHQKTPSLPNQDKTQVSKNNSDLIREYLRDNLSDLSPEKEVLGGKFYITKLQFLENNQGIVEYEDGHIALRASFNFQIDEDQVQIDNFQIIPENDNAKVIITDEHMKCTNHDDCVPLPGCHPHECINQKYQDHYQQPDLCTLEYDNCATYQADDCLCQQGICFNENLMDPSCR